MFADQSTIRAPLPKSSFYCYFHKLCSGANQISFCDFRNKLGNYGFSGITSEVDFMAISISGALAPTKKHFENYSILLSQHDIAVLLYHQIITLSGHRLLCHVFVGPPIAYVRIGGSTGSMHRSCLNHRLSIPTDVACQYANLSSGLCTTPCQPMGVAYVGL